MSKNKKNIIFSILQRHLNKYGIFYIFCSALILRLFYTYFIRAEAAAWHGDEGVYFRFGRDFLAGYGYYSTSRMPLLPLIIALGITMFGKNPQLLHLIGCFLGSLIPVGTYFLCSKLTKNKNVALLAGFLLAFSPFFIHEASYLDTENLFIPLVVWFFIILADIMQDPKPISRYILLGFIFTLICLTRQTFLMFPAFLLIYWVIKKWPIKIIFQRFSIFILVFMILISPWIVHLYRVQGRVILIGESNGAIVGANNPITLLDSKLSGSWINLDNDYPQVIPEVTGIPGARDYETGFKEYIYSLNIFKKYPRKVIPLFLNKLKWLWSYSPKHPANRNFSDDLIGLLSYGIFLPFFILALIELKRELLKDFAILTVVYISTFVLLSYGSSRFRLFADPILYSTVVYYIWLKIFKK